MDIKFHEGQYIVGMVSPATANELIPSIFDYIEYEFNKQSVWELFLLNISDMYMPKFWHACYGDNIYIFERADLANLVSRGIMHWDSTRRESVDITSSVASYLVDEALLPEITILSETEAHIRYTYWNNWRGLCRRVEKIAKENGTTTFTQISDDILVEYDCGYVL